MLDKQQVLEILAAAPDGSRANFYGSPIGDVDFRDVVFEGAANFAGAVFTGEADFSGATFKQAATFEYASFRKSGSFIRTEFERGATFSLGYFQDLDFYEAQLHGRAVFWAAQFNGKANFEGIKVRKAEWLPQHFDGKADFSWSRFHNQAIFTYAEFAWPVYFHRTLFDHDVKFDQCRFDDLFYLNGKQNEVLFPRFGRISPLTVGKLEEKGLVRADTERYRGYGKERMSEFVCFNNILSDEDLTHKLDGVPDLSQVEKEVITGDWKENHRKMFADGRLLTFNGARFADLEKVQCLYLELENVASLDRNIAGSSEERRLFEKRLRAVSADVFISHASEDKEALARPLCQKLREMGYSVWLDELQLEAGDELADSLNHGMEQARFGLIIVSPHFLNKKWTRYEMDIFLEQSKASGKKLVFIWHGVEADEIEKRSSALAGAVALDTKKFTIDKLAEKVATTIR